MRTATEGTSRLTKKLISLIAGNSGSAKVGRKAKKKGSSDRKL